MNELKNENEQKNEHIWIKRSHNSFNFYVHPYIQMLALKMWNFYVYFIYVVYVDLKYMVKCISDPKMQLISVGFPKEKKMNCSKMIDYGCRLKLF